MADETPNDDATSETAAATAEGAPESTEPSGDAPKAEEPKAEEPKAEEPKAEEPKAEEPKAEEPKAEEPKAEKKPEPKAEKKPEPKAEKKPEPKAEKKPKPRGAATKSLASKKGKKAEEGDRARRIGEEEEKTSQEIFMENLPTIIVVAVLFALIPIWWTSHKRTTLENSQQAWEDLGQARDQPLGKAKFESLAKRHQGTSAAPYIKVSWASKLYETGEKAKVQRAVDLYKEILTEYGHVPLIKRLVPDLVKTIEAELVDARAHWVEPTATPEKDPLGTAPPTSASKQ
jgi:outer membrane biosynthesis protein TonB